MASDLRFMLVLSTEESLICGECEKIVKGDDYPSHSENTVYIADPNEASITIKCKPCYLKEGRESDE